jgi:hypothetical protein
LDRSRPGASRPVRLTAAATRSRGSGHQACPRKLTGHSTERRSSIEPSEVYCGSRTNVSAPVDIARHQLRLLSWAGSPARGALSAASEATYHSVSICPFRNRPV